MQALPVSSLLLHTQSKEWDLSSWLELRREADNIKNKKLAYSFNDVTSSASIMDGLVSFLHSGVGRSGDTLSIFIYSQWFTSVHTHCQKYDVQKCKASTCSTVCFLSFSTFDKFLYILNANNTSLVITKKTTSPSWKYLHIQWYKIMSSSFITSHSFSVSPMEKGSHLLVHNHPVLSAYAPH